MVFSVINEMYGFRYAHVAASAEESMQQLMFDNKLSPNPTTKYPLKQVQRRLYYKRFQTLLQKFDETDQRHNLEMAHDLLNEIHAYRTATKAKYGRESFNQVVDDQLVATAPPIPEPEDLEPKPYDPFSL